MKSKWKLKEKCCPLCGYSRRTGYTHGISLVDRFWAKVKKATGNGCWTWQGVKFKGKFPYGTLWVAEHGKKELAHRVAWFLATGKWPKRQVLHSCDNPSCVRFSHLYLGNQKDNVQDMIKKGRAPWQK